MIREAIAALVEGRSLTEEEAATFTPKPRLQPGGRRAAGW
jgi:hypothetical protein